MKTVTALEAKKHFGELLDRVARGEDIVITRHDKPVARTVSEGDRRLEDIRRAVEDLHPLRKEMAQRKGFKPLSDKEIKDAINKGSALRRTTRGFWRDPWSWRTNMHFRSTMPPILSSRYARAFRLLHAMER